MALAEHPELLQLPRLAGRRGRRGRDPPGAPGRDRPQDEPDPGRDVVAVARRGGRRSSTRWSRPTSRTPRRPATRRPRSGSSGSAGGPRRADSRRSSASASEIQRLSEKIGAADAASVKDRNSVDARPVPPVQRGADRTSRSQRIAAQAKLEQLRNEKTAPPRSAGRSASSSRPSSDAFYSRPAGRRSSRSSSTRAEVQLGGRAAIRRDPSDPSRVRPRDSDRDAEAADRRALGPARAEAPRQVLTAGPVDDDDDRARRRGRGLAGRRCRSQETPLERQARPDEDREPGGRRRRAQPGVRPPRPGPRRSRLLEHGRGQPQPARVRGPEPDRPGPPGVPGQAVEPAELEQPDEGHGPGAVRDGPGGDGAPVRPAREARRAGWSTPTSCRAGSGSRSSASSRRCPTGPAPADVGRRLARRDEFRARRQLDEFVQSLDHLRVALCARPDPWGRDRHCVLITSACGSEGKTTLAAQLAERCVNAGLMTLLIDADLRNPTLSRMLDAAESPGLINVLRGEVARRGRDDRSSATPAGSTSCRPARPGSTPAGCSRATGSASCWPRPARAST